MSGRPKVAQSVRDRIQGMNERGETCRSIAEQLVSEGINISHVTVSRIIKEQPPSVRPPVARREQVVQAKPTQVSQDEHNDDTQDEPIVIPDDPRELARQDWLFYERTKEELRRDALKERRKGNLRGYENLLKLAEKAEKRASELRPPIPPDPMKDPTYLKEAQNLTMYIEHLVSKCEQNEAIPERALPPTEPIAA